MGRPGNNRGWARLEGAGAAAGYHQSNWTEQGEERLAPTQKSNISATTHSAQREPTVASEKPSERQLIIPRRRPNQSENAPIEIGCR